MLKLTEIIPDDMPFWVRKAMKEGQFFNKTLSRIKELEQENQKCDYALFKANQRIPELEAEVERLKEIECMYNDLCDYLGIRYE